MNQILGKQGFESLPMSQGFLLKLVYSINISLNTYYVLGTLLFRNSLNILVTEPEQHHFTSPKE